MDKFSLIDNKYCSVNDQPAIIFNDGTKAWFSNNMLNRLNGPAITKSDGSKYWYVSDKLHSINDNPAVELSDSTKIWFNYGKLYRTNNVVYLSPKIKVHISGSELIKTLIYNE